MHYGRAHTVSIETDEDGFTLTLEGVDEGDGIFRCNISDIAEEFYDRVKAAILPWLMERDEAFSEYRQYAERGTGPAAEYFARKALAEDAAADAEDARVVAIREDGGSLRMDPDEDPDDWRERLAGNAYWSRKAERENR